jgi:hypothetical protein
MITKKSREILDKKVRDLQDKHQNMMQRYFEAGVDPSKDSLLRTELKSPVRSGTQHNLLLQIPQRHLQQTDQTALNGTGSAITRSDRND